MLWWLLLNKTPFCGLSSKWPNRNHSTVIQKQNLRGLCFVVIFLLFGIHFLLNITVFICIFHISWDLKTFGTFIFIVALLTVRTIRFGGRVPRTWSDWMWKKWRWIWEEILPPFPSRGQRQLKSCPYFRLSYAEPGRISSIRSCHCSWFFKQLLTCSVRNVDNRFIRLACSVQYTLPCTVRVGSTFSVC